MKKKTFYAKVKHIDLHAGNNLQVVLNESQAYSFGITSVDDVTLVYKRNWERHELIVNADLTNNLVDSWEIWITRDIYEKYEIKKWDLVAISAIKNNPLSLLAIKKKLLWEKLNEKEIKALMRDMTDGKISDILSTYYAACSFAYPSDDHELYLTAKYSAEMWDMIKFDQDTAVKYCIWGIPGNETTMIIVPILGSLWISSPKTFSKAITSPAATGECVEVLMDTEFSVDEMKKLVKKTGSCLAWGKHLKFAPANDKIIKVSYPLYMEAYGKVAVSIMAKIYAWGTKYCLIDLPVGEYGKIKDLETAKRIKGHFNYIGKRLGMKMKVDITDANSPVWKWVWAVLQVREVLRILQNKENISLDLKNKAIELAANLIELTWLAKWGKAKMLAKKQLESGDAWKYMQKLIKAQNTVHTKNPDYEHVSYLWVVDAEELPLWGFSYNIIADKSWKIKKIDVEFLKYICRVLGAPLDKRAWFYLNKQVGDKVKKWDMLCEIYSNDEDKLKQAIENYKEKKLYKI